MYRLTVALALATAAVAASGGSALAHGPDGIFDPITMDPYTPVSKLDVDLGYIAYDEAPDTDLTVVGLAVSGQYVTPQGLGGYLTIPLSYLSMQVPPLGLDESELSLGNVEVGGIYSKYIGPHSAVVVHAGLALPTASDEGVGAFQALAAAPRYGDFVQRVPQSTWLRLGVSPMGRSGKLFWRADLGIDLALDEDASDISPVFRVNVGGGIDLGSAHILAELVTDVIDDGAGDEVASTLAIGARFLSGNLRPGVALLVPVGFDEQFDLDFGIAFSLAARL